MVKRVDLIKAFASMVGEDTLVVTPIGSTTAYWEELGRGPTSLTSVSLGMCTPAALGVALALPHRKVVALDSVQSRHRGKSKTAQPAHRGF
jgi:thiamine pyrophosphate-dependent acetolactate synthase large subunit-like protein